MARATPVLAVHGGAGDFTRVQLDPQVECRYRSAIEAALRVGSAMLEEGSSAEAAVLAAVVELEDSPVFNAGRGSVRNADGRFQLDAAIMAGRDRSAGAVAAVERVPNPVRLAELVRLGSPHVLLVGHGAEAFAIQQGQKLVANEYFVRPADADRAQLSHLAVDKRHGTVGAVARDAAGHLAAATSTGGLRRKAAGRVGDSPLIGAGTWADDASCAVSCTGDGEFFIRAAVAHDVAARIAYAGETLGTATDAALATARRLGGTGGLIAIDRHGRIATPHTTSGMIRGTWSGDGLRVAFFHQQ